MKKIIILLFVIMFSFFFFDFGAPKSQAVDLNIQVKSQLQSNFEKSGLGSNIRDPRIIIATIIQLFLGFIGAIFLILIAMSSFWYITARGQADKIEKATTTIRGAIIGLIIVMMAYSITYFVSKNVQKAIGARVSYNIELLSKFV